jgi:acyl carrier protein
VESDDNAVGYRNLPALTADRFRLDPRYGSSPAYFTGDLGRHLGDGSLLHVGRKDFQIKMHGYQLSATEVEGMLCNVAGVRDACVVAQALPGGNERLVAFVVRASPPLPSAAALRTSLSNRLPDYMVPHRFVDAADLPRTATGKVDRRALMAMPIPRGELDADRVAPRTSIESSVAAIWEEVLEVSALSVHDDFVTLGGDSLSATRITHRVAGEFGVELSLSAVLAGHTVARMAALIAGSEGSRALRGDATSAGDVLPPARRRRIKGR